MPLFMLLLIRAGRLHEGAWRPWSRAALDRGALTSIAKVGVPIGLHFAAEIWGFQIVSLWAGVLERSSSPRRRSCSTSPRCRSCCRSGGAGGGDARGNLIGERRHDDAQTASWSALALGAA